MIPKRAAYGRRLAELMPKALQHLKANRVKKVVAVVVDGLGWENLRTHAQLAPNLLGLSAERLETVAPSTTAAALTTITTGVLPGQHGLVGYKILNPATGRITQTLKDWAEITDVREWQFAPTVFESARRSGFAARVFARPAHSNSGLTGAILTAAEYIGGQRIKERIALAQQSIAANDGIFYIYVDELDKAGHQYGWGSVKWRQILSEIDLQVGWLLVALPRDTGFFLTADHGMINVAAADKRVLEDRVALPPQTRVGGEGRFRSLYLADPGMSAEVVAQVAAAEGGSCTVGTRADFIAAGVFGEVRAEVLPRLGDVMLVARKNISYLSTSEPQSAAHMVGHHGGLTDTELGVPLLTNAIFKGAL